jgi:hypothetical protein
MGGRTSTGRRESTRTHKLTEQVYHLSIELALSYVPWHDEAHDGLLLPSAQSRDPVRRKVFPRACLCSRWKDRRRASETPVITYMQAILTQE